jgi:hypothetical protein
MSGATLVDTNVLLDILTNDARWAGWSINQMDAAAARGPIVVNEVVYAEVSVRYAAFEAFEAQIGDMGLALEPTPRAALFLAGKAFRRYRRSGGTRTGVLPDFFIGAHCVVAAIPLLTRDGARYRTYFPTIRLITPS